MARKTRKWVKRGNQRIWTPVYYHLSKEEKQIINIYKRLESAYEIKVCAQGFIWRSPESIRKIRDAVYYIAWQVFPKLFTVWERWYDYESPWLILFKGKSCLAKPRGKCDSWIKKKTIRLFELWSKLEYLTTSFCLLGIALDENLQPQKLNNKDIILLAISQGRFIYSIPASLNSTELKQGIGKLHTQWQKYCLPLLPKDYGDIPEQSLRNALAEYTLFHLHWGAHGLKHKREEPVAIRNEKIKQEAIQLSSKELSLNRIANILAPKHNLAWSTIRRKLSAWKIKPTK